MININNDDLKIKHILRLVEKNDGKIPLEDYFYEILFRLNNKNLLNSKFKVSDILRNSYMIDNLDEEKLTKLLLYFVKLKLFSVYIDNNKYFFKLLKNKFEK